MPQLKYATLSLLLSLTAHADTPCDNTHMADPTAMVGVVLETMDAASYTYVRLNTSAQGTWAAIPQTPVAPGDCLVLQQPQRMVDFTSPTLGRTFSEIYFATVDAAPDDMRVAAAHTQADAPQPIASGQPVAPATGADARTVAQVHAQREQLAGTQVVVRGRVTKVSAGIQGKTWLHLADGSAPTGADDADLIVTTTQDGVVAGEIVKASGQVALDLDLGFGYRYDVLLQDASISR